jgi:hypothetical protein
MEHRIHLGSGSFIKSIAPTSTSAVIKKIQRDTETEGSSSESPDLAQILTQSSDDPNDGNTVDSDHDEEFTTGDSVGKVLALVNQVSSTNRLLYCHANNCSSDTQVSTSSIIFQGLLPKNWQQPSGAQTLDSDTLGISTCCS